VDNGFAFKLAIYGNKIVSYGPSEILEYDQFEMSSRSVPLEGVSGLIVTGGKNGQTYIVATSTILYSKSNVSIPFVRRGGLDFNNDNQFDKITHVFDGPPNVISLGSNFAWSPDGLRFTKSSSSLITPPSVLVKFKGFLVYGGKSGVAYGMNLVASASSSDDRLLEIPESSDGVSMTGVACNSILVFRSVDQDGSLRDDYMICGFANGYTCVVKYKVDTINLSGGGLEAEIPQATGMDCIHHLVEVGGRVAVVGFNTWKYVDEIRVNRIVSGVPLS